MSRIIGRLTAAAFVFVLAGCHEEGAIVVKDVAFTGLHAVSDGDLKAVLATRESGWLPWSPKHYFDRAEFEADLQRIHAYYADHGYPSQRVRGVDVDLAEDRSSVRVRIDIDEGEPVVVEAVRFEGLEPLPENVRRQVDAAPLKAGAPRDRNAVRATRDLTTSLFKNNGYPLAAVDAGERPGEAPHSVVVTFRANAGEEMRFGEFNITGLEHVTPDVVQRQIVFEPGDLYRERLVRLSQRRLSSLELFDLANISPRMDEPQGERVPVRVTVAEGPPRRLRLGIGYGTEERARGTVDWQHVNFLGGARKAEVEARASFLERSVRLNFTEPYLWRPGWSLTVSGRAEHLEQLSYSSESYGGRASIAYQTETSAENPNDAVRYNVRFGYAHEHLKYGVRADALQDLSRREERIALGLDPETGRGAGTLASVDFDLERRAVDDPVAPRRGTILSLHLEHAAPWLFGGTYRFDEVLVEGRAYRQVGPAVLASRVNLGSVIAEDSTTIPFSRRYFLGGSTSLRGWGRFQVGPLNEDGLPIGGRALVLLSSELRFPAGGKLNGVAFVDAGSVGSSDWSDERLRLRVNIGPGLRYQTPVGPLRADLGYQLNPIPGLVVNGEPERRHWRVHVSIGQAF
ncbi:MAG: BamA/TamA family outer membrane protein [Acidobacteria bacterium]|nr:BamA/TamA family outer membrane protein [Acidobacteriota bacterium]